mmetsp:Transcript_6677/g.14434  ORF Transcript_6677/g.14434 Transcript_6677/m.14434 type:complete len:108 (-) Transcript_6677:639-962(-)
MMGPETKTSYQGGGMARVDVYCRTGTVCTCHMVPVTTGDVATTICSSDAILVPNFNSLTLFSALLATPRMVNFQVGATSDNAASKATSPTMTTNHPHPPNPMQQILR